VLTSLYSKLEELSRKALDSRAKGVRQLPEARFARLGTRGTTVL
jgi:hypothetical protein